MSKETISGKIGSYLNATFKIRNSFLKHNLVAHHEGYEDPAETFIVTPWDIEQMKLNIRKYSRDEITSLFTQKPDSFNLEEKEGATKVVLRSDSLPGELTPIPEDRRDVKTITVLDAFKWYLYHKINVFSDNGEKTVGVNEAVFSLKNELFLPDDFVPRVLMEMVEGSKIVDVEDTVEKIQPTGQDMAIIILGKHDNGIFLEPDSFYVRTDVGGEVPSGMENLGFRLSESFAEFQKTKEYEYFLLSRVMRNVIFTVETKKKRDLMKPLFDVAKLELLGKHGVASVKDGVWSVPDNLSVEGLREIKTEAEARAERASDTWFQSHISV